MRLSRRSPHRRPINDSWKLTPRTTTYAVTSNNEVVENLIITPATGTDGLTIGSQSGVIIRKCIIFHDTAEGINCGAAVDLLVEDVWVINTITTDAPLASSNYRNMSFDSSGSGTITVRRCRVEGGSTGAYFNHCHNVVVDKLEGYNQRGDFPRGQLLQVVDPGGTTTVTDIYNWCDPDITKSYPEDNISFIECDGVTFDRGYIHGNNSRTGVAVMVEGCDGVDVTDVDCFYQGNGCFSVFPSGGPIVANDVTYLRCRTKHVFDTDQGRGVPSSGGQCFTNWSSGTTNTHWVDCDWYNSPGGVSWLFSEMDTTDWAETDFTPREPFKNKFGWDYKR